MKRLTLILIGAGVVGCATQPVVDSESVQGPTRVQDCAWCPELVIVPPGSFTMGSPIKSPQRPEGPMRQVTIDYFFALGRYEVTVAQFRRFLDSTGYQPASGCRVWAEGDVPSGGTNPRPAPGDGPWRGFVDDPAGHWLNPGWRREVDDNDPVVCVSWRDAVAYVDWLAEETGQPYRLPTEAEWEYVARAGTTGQFPWGDRGADGCAHANIYDQSAATEFGFPWEGEACDDGFSAAAPVGQFLPNRFGVYDIIGNVWEWTQDCYREYYPEEPADGRPFEAAGDCPFRTVRGGSWITHISRQRPTFRGRDPDGQKDSFFGFRVARDIID